MKKLIAILLAAVMLLSVSGVTAFAENAQPAFTVGPAQDSYLYGGPCVYFFDPVRYENIYVVEFDYTARQLVVNNEEVPGATYDAGTNTLNIKDLHMQGYQLTVWYMGDDFKINVDGACELGKINVGNPLGFHSTSLSVRGAGTLTVNQDLRNDVAVNMYADGENSMMHLDIADSVTVDLYSRENTEDDDEDYYPVVDLDSTRVTPANGGAITVGGKAAPEAQSRQIVDMGSDTVKTLAIESPNKDFEHGKQVKSKSDPDGVYAMAEWDDGDILMVMRYMYVSDINMWVFDSSFGEGFYNGRRYNQAEFDEEYTFVIGNAPKQIKYTTLWNEENRGEEAVMLVKSGEPDAVYAGVARWGGEDYDVAVGYTVYRVLWNENEEFYVEDGTFKSAYYATDELEGAGYSVATEEVEEPLTLEVWTAPAPFDEESGNWTQTPKAYNRASDPDGLYVRGGTYTDGDGETGVVIKPVHYDPVYEQHYILYNDYSSAENFYVSDESLENGTSDFSPAVDIGMRPVELNFLKKNYSSSYIGQSAVQLSKDGDPDTVYAYNSWAYVSHGTETAWHTLIKLDYNEKKGRYIEDEEFDTYDFIDLQDIEAMGYHVVMAEQPLDYVTKGRVELGEYPVYKDKGGSTYYVDYEENVYSFMDEDLITIGGEQYYYGMPMPNKRVEDLISTEHEVVTDNYAYWIPGGEYHHVGSAAPQPQKFTLSGKLTTFPVSDGDVTMTLQHPADDNGPAWSINTTLSGDLTDYEIADVPAGSYTLTVSKANHVTRSYEVNVTGNKTQDVKIHPVGDFNGDGQVTTADVLRANSHAKGKKILTDPYQFACLDVVGTDKSVSTADVLRLNSHAKGKKLLW